jgi:heptosyltransferase-3
MDPVQTILIFKHGLLGDVIVTIPALHLLRINYPNARLIMLLEKLKNEAHLISRDFLLETRLVDEVIDFNTSSSAELFRLTQNLWRFRSSALFALNLERFGWNRKREVFCYLMGIFKVFGPSCLPRISLGANNNLAHQLYGIAFVSCFGTAKAVDTKTIAYPELTTAKGINTFIEWSSKNPGIRKYSGIALLGIWSNMESKRWPIERFVDTAEYLTSKFNLLPVCVGGTHEEELQAANYITSRSLSLSAVGKMSISESYEYFKHATLYIGNDTGAMHLAAAAGIPCVAIFSAREKSDLWHPIGPAVHHVLKARPACSGCQLRVCKIPYDRCVDRVTAKDVMDAVDRVLCSNI